MSDHRKSEEEKFREFVRSNFEQINQTQRSFAMNLGSIARELGMNPKTFVKALYSDKKNKNFYMKTLVFEQEYAMKRKQKEANPGFIKRLINKFKSNDQSNQRRAGTTINRGTEEGSTESGEENGKTTEASR